MGAHRVCSASRTKVVAISAEGFDSNQAQTTVGVLQAEAL